MDPKPIIDAIVSFIIIIGVICLSIYLHGNTNRSLSLYKLSRILPGRFTIWQCYETNTAQSPLSNLY